MRRLPVRTASPSVFLARYMMMLKSVIAGQSAVTAVRIRFIAPPLFFNAIYRINGTARASSVKTRVDKSQAASFAVNVGT